MIRIDVVRSDGEVTRLTGESGMATCMGPVAEDVDRSDPPTVSLRCDSTVQLAWNLAALMAAVRHVSPEAFATAHELMEYCDFDRPVFRRKLRVP